MSNETKTIELETTFTPWTLDTYQTFTFKRAEEMEIDYWSDKLGLNLDYNDFEWTYHNEEFLQALADELEKTLKEYILDDVIKGLEFGAPTSPRQYNFTTDKSFVEWEVDMDKLNEYIEENKEDFEDNKISSGPGFMWLGDEEETKLNYYLKKESTKKFNSRDGVNQLREFVYPREFMDVKVREEVLEDAGKCPNCEEELDEAHKVEKMDRKSRIDLETGDEEHMCDQATLDPVVFLCPECKGKISEDRIANLKAIEKYKKNHYED